MLQRENLLKRAAYDVVGVGSREPAAKWIIEPRLRVNP